MVKKRKNSSDVKAPVEKLEVIISSNLYDFLEEKVEKEVDPKDVKAEVKSLVNGLLSKAILEYKLLTPNKTLKDFSSELTNLYLFE